MKNKLLGFLLGLAMVGSFAIAQDWYEATGVPVARSLLNSADLRTEFAAIETDIAAKLPALTGNGNKVVVVNSGGTALTVAETGIAVSAGGTGATTASGARTNLGLVIGTNVQAYDADIVTSSTDTFTGTFTGFSGTAPTPTMTYVIVGNLVTIQAPASGISGTSNADTMTMTGMPVAARPSAVRRVPCLVLVGSATYAALASIATNGTVTFQVGFANNALAATGFETSGAKGIASSSSFSYLL